MLPITVCIICKNEEKNIEECLKRLKTYGLTIVVTDTGSRDATVEIAKKYADEVHYFEWCNDFSAARNYCASKAKTDWIWMVDADEYLEEFDEKLLDRLFEDDSQWGAYKVRSEYELDGIKDASIEYWTRIYNRTNTHYEGVIHEQLKHMDENTKEKFVKLNFFFNHRGYESTETLRKKAKRNTELLLEMLKEKESPYVYYQLGTSYYSISEYQKAVKYFEKGLEFDLNPAVEYVINMVIKYGYSLLKLKRNEDALGLEGVYDAFATNADFVFLMGLIFMNNGLFDYAIEEFEKATSYNECVVAGVNSYKAFYNAGVIEECRGNIDKARLFYEKCGEYEPAKNRLRLIIK